MSPRHIAQAGVVGSALRHPIPTRGASRDSGFCLTTLHATDARAMPFIPVVDIRRQQQRSVTARRHCFIAYAVPARHAALCCATSAVNMVICVHTKRQSSSVYREDQVSLDCFSSARSRADATRCSVPARRLPHSMAPRRHHALYVRALRLFYAPSPAPPMRVVAPSSGAAQATRHRRCRRDRATTRYTRAKATHAVRRAMFHGSKRDALFTGKCVSPVRRSHAGCRIHGMAAPRF